MLSLKLSVLEISVDNELNANRLVEYGLNILCSSQQALFKFGFSWYELSWTTMLSEHSQCVLGMHGVSAKEHSGLNSVSDFCLCVCLFVFYIQKFVFVFVFVFFKSKWLTIFGKVSTPFWNTFL